VKVSIDGTVLVDATNLPTDQSAAVTKRGAWAGLYGFETPACTIHLDDILIDVR
jgi:hypothetical protein